MELYGPCDITLIVFVLPFFNSGYPTRYDWKLSYHFSNVVGLLNLIILYYFTKDLIMQHLLGCKYWKILNICTFIEIIEIAKSKR